MMDSNRDGSLSRKELHAAADTLNVSQESIGGLFNSFDFDGNNALAQKNSTRL